MKRLLIVLPVFLAVVLLPFSSSAQEQLEPQSASSEHPLVGAWELVSATSPEGSVNDILMRDQLKLLTPTHYVVVVQVEEGDSLGVAHAAGTAGPEPSPLGRHHREPER